MSATEPLGKISIELGKDNETMAPTHVPDMVPGFLNIRETHGRALGDEGAFAPNAKMFPKTKKNILRLGNNPPGWLKELRGVYIIETFARSFESEQFAIAFSKIDMSSSISGNAKLRLSVLTASNIVMLHSRKTEETIELLEKYVGFWSNRAVLYSNERKKLIGKMFKKGAEENDFLNEDENKTQCVTTKLKSAPAWLQRFSEVACSAIETDVCFTE